jgi:hypothetical protein
MKLLTLDNLLEVLGDCRDFIITVTKDLQKEAQVLGNYIADEEIELYPGESFDEKFNRYIKDIEQGKRDGIEIKISVPHVNQILNKTWSVIKKR